MPNQVRCGGVTTDGVSDQLAPKENWKTDQGAAEVQAELPQELITEILLCSSVKGLLRFRCVSKSFCAFIDSDEFINLHCNRSTENKNHRKLIIRGHGPTERLHVIDVDSGVEEKIEKPYRKNPKPYGYCNGLVLLFVDSFKLALWNPSTQQYRNLPRCPVKVPSGGHSTALGMGLGYDSTRDDYKVVLIEDVEIGNNTHDLQLWIFRLRSNSWERIQDFPYRRSGPFVYFGYFVNGSMHWLCSPHGVYGLHTMILAFDVAKETISEVSQPLHLAKRQWYPTNLHVLDGRLCMSYFCYKPEEAVFYVREKDGTEFKWRELFYVTPEVPLLIEISRFKHVRVLGYSKEGDKVMLDLGFKCLVLYDLKERSFATAKNIKLVDDDPRKLCYNYQFLCLESCVSVGGGDFRQRRQSGQKRKKKGA